MSKVNKSIIAEIGSVHDGSLGNAIKAIELAALCGADVVKFQTHIAEAETLEDAPAPYYFQGESRFHYFKRTGFTVEQWKKIKEACVANNVSFLSSPFSLEAVDLLEEVGVDTYKIPSGEVSNIPMLEKIANLGKKVIVSSGMSNWAELDEAVAVFKGKCELSIMQCSSAYPCPPSQVGLNIIPEMKERWGLPVGFSDHTLGCAASFAAATLGAVVIEKHLTFSKYMYGSDAKNSMEPIEFTNFINGLHEIWEILDHPVNKDDTAPYMEMKRIFEKSIVTAYPIEANTILEISHLAFKKPGDGIPAAQYKRILGKIVKNNLTVNHKITQEDLYE
jgi:N,N'-diacetyllegionaminate synthase